MSSGCTHKVNIEGKEVTLSDAEFKAYIANGGLNSWYKDKPLVSIDERNKKAADKLVNNITDGKTTIKAVVDFLNQQKLSDKTKQSMEAYIRQQLKDKKRGTLAGLEDEERAVFETFDDNFANGVISYEQAMQELGMRIDKEVDPYKKEKLENVRDVFYKTNYEKGQRKEKEKSKKEFKNFNEEVNDAELGISDDELTLLQSDERIIRSGSVNMVDDLSLVESNDQVVAKFVFGKFAEDLSSLLLRFQQQFANNYINEMVNFTKDKNNKTEAKIKVQIALNNHLERLISTEKNQDKKLYYESVQTANAKLNQEYSRTIGLALNALKAWNSDKLPEMALVGIIKPIIATQAQLIRESIGTQISDEDMINDENDVEDDTPAETESKEPDSSGTKRATWVQRRRLNGEAKAIRVRNANEIKNEIKEQINKCK